MMTDLEKSISRILEQSGIPILKARPADFYLALQIQTDSMLHRNKKYEGMRKVFYVSAEFLLGRMLLNNLQTLGLYESAKALLEKYKISMEDVLEYEKDPGLGNGGLGRLAACFLDSAAYQGLCVDGFSLLYHFGLFQQSFEDDKQKERPDKWMSPASWLRRCDFSFDIQLGKHKVTAVIYVVDVAGSNQEKRTLYLADLDTVDEGILREDGTFDPTDILRGLTLKLYPDDSNENGRKLRVYQEYFLSAAAAAMILRDVVKRGGNVRELHKYTVVQLNDLHPALMIPELVRLLMAEGLTLEEAAREVTLTCAYTNHTILPEALETWPMAYIEEAAPETAKVLRQLSDRIQEKFEREGVQIIDIWNDVHMAHLAAHYCFSINGVAELHTDILKSMTLAQFYEIYPEKFNNKSNGVTFRRWLDQCNPELSAWIEGKIGTGFHRDPMELKNLLQYAEDEEALQQLLALKCSQKKKFCRYVGRELGISLNPDSLMDVQIKRIHFYKRQLMNALYAVKLYLRIKAGDLPPCPITMVFAGKAAPAYTLAKDLIHFILCLGKLISGDPEVSPYLTVLMIPNYSVSWASRIFPATDISEQISLASKEASGTGNMKAILNGAVILGTLDGANVEILEHVGAENIQIFGENSEQVMDRYRKNDLYGNSGYNPWDYYCKADIKQLADFIVGPEMLALGDRENLYRLYDDLIHRDYFMNLLDLESYISAKDQLITDYMDPMSWAKKCLCNIAGAGFFSSDRTIQQYNQDIWRL